MLQAHFCHSKGFICHEYTPAMICDFCTTDKTLPKRELFEGLVATTVNVGPARVQWSFDCAGGGFEQERCFHACTFNWAVLWVHFAVGTQAIDFPRFTAPCTLVARSWRFDTCFTVSSHCSQTARQYAAQSVMSRVEAGTFRRCIGPCHIRRGRVGRVTQQRICDLGKMRLAP